MKVTTEIHRCDVCHVDGVERDAYADAKIPGVGSWFYVCREHFIGYGCRLGKGHGERLAEHPL